MTVRIRHCFFWIFFPQCGFGDGDIDGDDSSKDWSKPSLPPLTITTTTTTTTTTTMTPPPTTTTTTDRQTDGQPQAFLMSDPN